MSEEETTLRRLAIEMEQRIQEQYDALMAGLVRRDVAEIIALRLEAEAWTVPDDGGGDFTYSGGVVAGLEIAAGIAREEAVAHD